MLRAAAAPISHLQSIFDAALKAHPKDRQRQLADFLAGVLQSPPAICELFDEPRVTHAAAFWFKRQYGHEATPEGDVGDPPQGGGEGQTSRAETALVAPPSPNPRRSDGQGRAAHGPTSNAIAATEPGGGHTARAPEAIVREPPPAHPSPEAIRAAAASAQRMTVSVFDTHRLRGGIAIGDVRFGDIEGLRAHSARDAALLRQIQKHVVPANPDTTVREAVSLEILQRFIQRAAEVADAI